MTPDVIEPPRLVSDESRRIMQECLKIRGLSKWTVGFPTLETSLERKLSIDPRA